MHRFTTFRCNCHCACKPRWRRQRRQSASVNPQNPCRFGPYSAAVVYHFPCSHLCGSSRGFLRLFHGLNRTVGKVRVLGFVWHWRRLLKLLAQPPGHGWRQLGGREGGQLPPVPYALPPAASQSSSEKLYVPSTLSVHFHSVKFM